MKKMLIAAVIIWLLFTLANHFGDKKYEELKGSGQ